MKAIVKETYYVGGTYGPTITIADSNDNEIYFEGAQIHASLNHREEDINNGCEPFHPEADWYLAFWTEEYGMLKTYPLKSIDKEEAIKEATQLIEKLDLNF